MSPTLLHLFESVGIVAGIYLVCLFVFTFWRDIRGAVTLKYCPKCAKEGRGSVALFFNRGYGRMECRRKGCGWHE